MSLPQADDLKYFYETAQCLNISHAAIRLGLSQPSLSQAIKRLEDCVGEKLFFRKKTGVDLTPAGLKLKAHTQELLFLWDHVKSKAKNSMEKVQGRIRLGCHPSIGASVLPTFLPDILKKYDELEFEFVHDLSRKITEDVASLRLDIGIVINPAPYPQLMIKKLGFDMVSLWSYEKNRSVRDLKKNFTLLVNSELRQAQFIREKLAQMSLYPSRVIESKDLELLAELATHRCGVVILPTNVASRSPYRLYPIVGGPTYRDEVAIVLHEESKRIKTLQVLMAEIQKGYLKSN
jgi:DNA-binding transcriptional LysR family regulator